MCIITMVVSSLLTQRCCSPCRVYYQPYVCPKTATDKAHAGMRDDVWGFFITAAALLLPVAPFQRVYDRFR